MFVFTNIMPYNVLKYKRYVRKRGAAMSSVKYDLPERVEGDLIRFAKKYDK